MELETDKVTVEIPAPAERHVDRSPQSGECRGQSAMRCWRACGSAANRRRRYMRAPRRFRARHEPDRCAPSPAHCDARQPIESRGAAAAAGAFDCGGRHQGHGPRRPGHGTGRGAAVSRPADAPHAAAEHARAAHRHSPARGRAHGAQSRRGAARHHLVRGGSDAGAGASGAARGRLQVARRAPDADRLFHQRLRAGLARPPGSQRHVSRRRARIARAT